MVRTGYPGAMKWLKITGIAVGVLLAIAAALPFFISLDDYVPQIEKQISAKLKEPVKLGKLRASLLPVPHVVIDSIVVGKKDDVKVGKVTVTPGLWSLLSSTKVIRSIEIDSLVLTQSALDKIPLWTKSDSKGPLPVRVESIRLDDATLQLDKSRFGPFDARVTLNESGEPRQVSIATQDGKLKALVTPEGPAYRVDATAKSWKLPMGPPVQFDELVIKGTATLSSAEFNDITARLYGGTVSGKASVDWRKGIQVRGLFDLNQVELKDLAPLLSPKTRVSGKLNAKPAFRASAADAGQLFNALRVETPFNVRNGVLHGIDIQKAATSMISKQGGGGETRFDQLSGHLLMERGAFQFSQLKIASGVLAADGTMNISAAKALSGRVNAKVNALGTSASVPLNVAGTLDAPLLLPTGAAIAGAVAGTAVLGPMLGTSVGAKIGNFAEGLFGGGKDEKKKK
jgi:uncharacterized protein involved in outer membrane biogenesis